MEAFLSGTDESRLVITVRGETDLGNAGDLLLRLVVLAGTATGQIALDLSQVTFMDLAGLRTLAAIDRHVRAGGGSIRMAAVSPEVARLFELAGPHGALPHILAPPLLPAPQHAAAPTRQAPFGAAPPLHDGFEPASGTEGY
jgi:anti-anti-sigma factor